MIKIYNRATLKGMFSNGNRPNEENFANLIDSMVNTVDDGITKNAENGLALAPDGAESSRVISFFENIQNDTPDWTIELGSSDNPGLTVAQPASNDPAKPRLFFQQTGKTGFLTDEPLADVHIKGIAGSDSRLGTYELGSVPADGAWHTVIDGLNGCRAFEVVAQAGGQERSGKYAMLHAIATSTFGKSKIKRTQSHYGFCWNRIKLRFSGNQNGYKLEMKTASQFGTGHEIKFHITNLWDNSIANLIK